MNLAALADIDPDDLTPDERMALFGMMVLERERLAIVALQKRFEPILNAVPVRGMEVG